MPLAPPPHDEVYSSLDQLLHAVNQHAKIEGYAVVKRRTTSGKDGVNRAWLCCDRGREHHSLTLLEFQQRSTGSRGIGCPFAAKAKYDGVYWTFEVTDSSHNHEPSLDVSAHPKHRHLPTSAMQMIAQESAAGATPRQIESILRLATPDLAFTRKDIVNARQRIRLEELGSNTPVQALLLQLQQGNWLYESVTDSQIRVRSLFFAHPQSLELFRRHPEIVLLDCTYKTNRFQLPLLSMVGMTALGSSFFIAFALLEDEKEKCYSWALGELLKLFPKYGGTRYATGPEVFVSDRDLGLMGAIRTHFRRTPHLLCLWHINKCIVAKCKLLFDKDDQWEQFYGDWHSLVAQLTMDDFDKTWAEFRSKWGPSERGESSVYPDADYTDENLAPSTPGVEYLGSTWLQWKRKWAKPWKNQVRHFDNLTTSVVEGSHAVLKKYLQVSTRDLKKVVDHIQLMLISQHSMYLANISRTELRIPHELKIPPFAVIRRFVAPGALRKVLLHYKRLSEVEKMPACTGVFTLTLGLPCAHVLRHAINSERPLQLDVVHSHWHFRPLVQPSTSLEYNLD